RTVGGADKRFRWRAADGSSSPAADPSFVVCNGSGASAGVIDSPDPAKSARETILGRPCRVPCCGCAQHLTGICGGMPPFSSRVRRPVRTLDVAWTPGPVGHTRRKKDGKRGSGVESGFDARPPFLAVVTALMRSG